MDFDVEADEVGQRIDIVVIKRVPGLGRARAKTLFEDGMVRINGKRVRKGTRVGSGDNVTVSDVPSPTDFEPEAASDDRVLTLYEDSELIVLSKPAGMPSHPLRPDETGTLVNVIVDRFPDVRGIGYAKREAGIIHRLDSHTSGILVVARSKESFDRLTGLLKSAGLDKRYQALCNGVVTAPRIIDYPIAGDPADRRKVRAIFNDRDFETLQARPAETELLKSEPVGPYSLVDIRARRGARHQIRAHLATLGNPLVGDELYGGPACILGHHFLHASEITIPRLDAENLVIKAELPPEHQAILDGLAAK